MRPRRAFADDGMARPDVQWHVLVFELSEEIGSRSLDHIETIINRDNKVGKQLVLVRSTYTTRHYLMDELKKAESADAAKIPEAASV